MYGAPQVPARQSATTLPEGVVLRVEAGGCLGPCVSYVADLDAQGTVTMEREGARVRWRIGERRAQRARAQALQLADGPSFDAFMATDFQWKGTAVRVDGAVARHEQYGGDFRVTDDARAQLKLLERSLGIRARLR